MSYTPRGNVKTILDKMAEHDPDQEWTTAELCEIVGISVESLSSTIKTALRHEMLFKQKRGIHSFYSLTSYEPKAEPDAFNAALWADGDLHLYGLTQLDDGGWAVPVDEVPKLRRLLGAPAQ